MTMPAMGTRLCSACSTVRPETHSYRRKSIQNAKCYGLGRFLGRISCVRDSHPFKFSLLSYFTSIENMQVERLKKKNQRKRCHSQHRFSGDSSNAAMHANTFLFAISLSRFAVDLTRIRNLSSRSEFWSAQSHNEQRRHDILYIQI